MDNFCEDAFWDSNLTWGSASGPEFTQCFQDTVLLWAGSIWLLVTAPLYIYVILQYKTSPLDRSWLYGTKMAIVAVQLSLRFTELSSVVENLNTEGMSPWNAHLIGLLVEGLTLFLVVFYMELERRKGFVTSGILTLYWFTSALCGVALFYSKYNKQGPSSNTTDIFHVAVPTTPFEYYYGLTIVQLVLMTFPEPLPEQPNGKKDCLLGRASFISRCCFTHVDNFMVIGSQRKFNDDDFPRVMPTEQSENVVPLFESFWNKEQEKQIAKQRVSDDNKPRISLLKVLLQAFGLPLLSSNLLKLLFNVFFFIQPVMLGYLIGFAEDSSEPTWKGFVYLAGFVVCECADCVLINYIIHLCCSISARIRSALINAIYKKSLTMTNRARAESTVGEVINLISVDVNYIRHWFAFCWLFWSTVLQIIVSFGMLYNLIGVAALAGVAVNVLVIPLNAYVSQKGHKLHVTRMDKKDNRIKLMTEILNGIKVLKLYAWELAFGEKILDMKNEELIILRKQRLLGLAGSIAWVLSPFLMGLAMFASYITLHEDHVLDAKTAFGAIALLGIINHGFSCMPHFISDAVRTLTSIGRIEKFLNNEDIDDRTITHEHSDNAISIQDGTFTWDSKLGACLKGITMNVPTGSLVAVVGTVGAGKSSLISAILGEMDKDEGQVNVYGRTGYVPQAAWIQNETLRNNILFGNKYKPRVFNDVVKACALTRDLEILPGADKTEIGEKGINLSGGQKQRVSLARAVYNNADIYLLDDPLSAVDAHVGKHIFDQVIGTNGLLKNKTRVLVTHGITWLPHVDQIVVMEKGAITESGSYQQLMDNDGAFSKFIREYKQDGSSTDDNEDKDVSLPVSMTDSGYNSPSSSDKVTEVKPKHKILKRHPSQIRWSISRSISHEVDLVDDTYLENTDSILTEIIEDTVNMDKTEKTDNKVIKDNKQEGNIIEEEEIEDGEVRWENIKPYFIAVGITSCVYVIISFILIKIFGTSTEIWLKEWTSDMELLNLTVLPSDSEERQLGNTYYVKMYAVLGLLHVSAHMAQKVIFAYSIVRAAKVIHSKMLTNVLRGPMSFFDTTPVGRIIGRFSSDMDPLDGAISDRIDGLLHCLFDMCTIFSVIIYTIPDFAYIILPMAITAYWIKCRFVPCKRQVNRLHSKKRSPLFSHFSETLNGTSVIRAFGNQVRFEQTCAEKLDAHQEINCQIEYIDRWLGCRLDMLNLACFAFTAFVAILHREILMGAVVGLILKFAFELSGNMQRLMRVSSEIQNDMVCLEKIGQYSNRKPEAALTTSITPPQSWPASGGVEMTNLSLRYRDGLDLVLHDVNLSVQPGEKIGIVGRTGAGKSSLTLGLFRLIEPATGRVVIDDIDTSDLGLFDLRSNLTILPQDPILFSGTLRSNLDPLNVHTDEAIYTALEHAHLKKFIDSLPNKMEYECGEGGQNLSMGQRQLMCLARSLLRKSKVLVLDEATAAVDMQTDELIQNTIKKEFKECTVLTIAHRLNTIIDYDRILVLEQGHVKEFDRPQTLLANKSSVFYGMAKDAGLVK